MQSIIIQQIQDVVEFLDSHVKVRPEIAIMLGSGLGGFANKIENPQIISYADIPHFHKPSVDGHAGRIVFGTLRGVPMAVLQGRWHFYEGHSMNSIVLPIRAMAGLGAHTTLLTNAAGGINLSFSAGDLMLIDDHINLMGDNPLTGKDSALFGPRFPDMSEPYSKDCIHALEEAAKKLSMPLKKGVYIGLRGPTYETPAEVRMLRTLGGDSVGMSTVPEAIAARHLGMRVIGISCITNMAAGIEPKTLNHEEVQETAARAMEPLSNLIMEALPELAQHSVLPLPKANPLKR